MCRLYSETESMNRATHQQPPPGIAQSRLCAVTSGRINLT